MIRNKKPRHIALKRSLEIECHTLCVCKIEFREKKNNNFFDRSLYQLQNGVRGKKETNAFIR